MRTPLVINLLALCLLSFPMPSQTLVVDVCNFSRADQRMVAQGEAIASQIFKGAGVETVWFTADDPAHPGKSSAARLLLQVFPGRSKRFDMKDAFGITMSAADQTAPSLADVFFGNIEDVATTRTDETFLLGYVMAHEVGHILGLTHVPDTIMAEGWTARDIPRMEAGRVRFSSSQAERLRAAVAVRLNAPAPK